MKARKDQKNERGFSILEALIASVVLLIGISGLMALFAIAAAKNNGQGNQATRCTEYAQDKMEQLLALSYTPTSTDSTSQVVGANTICSTSTCTGYNSTLGFGLGGTTASTTYGAAGPGVTPVTGYVDYVNVSDTTHPDGISSTSTNAQYMRQWQIQNNAANNVKTITVYVKAQFTADVAQSLAPSTTLVAIKQQY